MTPRRRETRLLLKGTRTAMSFIAESRALGREHPYPRDGQAEYSALADVLSRAVLFANWQAVGAATLVRAGSTVRIAEMGLVAPFRSDEFMRRLTWRLLADAAHELADTRAIEDGYGQKMDITSFIARRRANRIEDLALQPVPIGRIDIPRAPGAGRRVSPPIARLPGEPLPPRGHSL